MKKVALFFFTALFFSLLFGFIASRFTSSDNMLILSYSFGVFLAVVIFKGIKTIKFGITKSSIAILLLAFLLPFLYRGILDFSHLSLFENPILTSLLLLTAAFFEEVGWRGYLFSQLKSYSWLKMNLIISIFWAGWHYPALLSGAFLITPPILLTLLFYNLDFFLLTLIFGWFRQKTNGLIGPTLIHASENISYLLFVGTGQIVISLKEEMVTALILVMVVLFLTAWRKPASGGYRGRTC